MNTTRREALSLTSAAMIAATLTSAMTAQAAPADALTFEAIVSPDLSAALDRFHAADAEYERTGAISTAADNAYNDKRNAMLAAGRFHIPCFMPHDVPPTVVLDAIEARADRSDMSPIDGICGPLRPFQFPEGQRPVGIPAKWCAIAGDDADHETKVARWKAVEALQRQRLESEAGGPVAHEAEATFSDAIDERCAAIIALMAIPLRTDADRAARAAAVGDRFFRLIEPFADAERVALLEALTGFPAPYTVRQFVADFEADGGAFNLHNGQVFFDVRSAGDDAHAAMARNNTAGNETSALIAFLEWRQANA